MDSVGIFELHSSNMLHQPTVYNTILTAIIIVVIIIIPLSGEVVT